MSTKESATHKAIVNDEDQWSIWLSDLPIPPGWRDVGIAGSEDECLKYIEKVWTDMRPRSLRAVMDANKQNHG